MLTGKKAVAIVDIDTVKDPDTGDRKSVVSRGIYGTYTVELVGVNTAMLGQSQGFALSYSVILPRINYNREKYVYFDGDLYEVKTLSKASSATDMLLNVQELTDTEKKSVIEEWIQANARPDTETV